MANNEKTVVSYNDEPYLEMVIFLYVPSVLGGDQNMYHVLFTRH